MNAALPAQAPADAGAPPTCLHADDDLLVLAKPSGLLCVPGRGPDKQDCLSARAAMHWPGACIVHRLDQATSGIVVMARHAQAQRALGDAFAARQVHKRYAAVVHAPHPAGDGDAWREIDLPIAADWERRPLRVVVPHGAPGGKASLTRWRPAAPGGGAGTCPVMEVDGTLRVLLEPVTGRTHQLRVHMAAIGQPILGDTLYAPPDVQALALRLLLHAQHIAFAHPRTGAPLAFDLPAPF
ncbi:RluA family pseudouridine synthase [Paracidovorax oryzae]|uniref:RluA family pseudouridine synthase n=1 Tax=Paracidovorax oryzae TaxID=862720 RepID=UPI0035CF0A7D